MSRLCFLVMALASIAYAAIECPKKDGQYEDPIQCDKFWECRDGVATEKLCPDGLVFDPYNRKINKCDHIFNVECEKRQELQPPQESKNCPRRNGFFAHPDPTVCNIFYNCIDGQFVENVCTVGLHFDEYSGICVWPQTANRQGCVDPDKRLNDGFQCPKDRQTDTRGGQVDHPKYAHPEDCRSFYICLNGVTPRKQGCNDGEVYNEEQGKCDAPENVPGCEDWYKESDEKPLSHH